MVIADVGPDTRRILVYGVTGSGKTTMAGRLGALTGLPWHAVDELTWEPGWVPVPVDVQRRRIEAICAEPAWILDSAYGGWLDIVLARADLVVGLDYPRWFSLQRLLRRCAMRLVDRKPICNGNRETLRALFARDSIVVWHFGSFARKRERIRRWSADPSGPSVRLLRSAREAQGWLHRLEELRVSPVADQAVSSPALPDRRRGQPDDQQRGSQPR